MDLVVHRAALSTDKNVILDALRRFLNPSANSRRFDWLYIKNPAGPASAWLAFDRNSEVPVGIAAAFPRRFYVSGTERLAWVLGDFAVDSAYRTLGPALALQRACLSDMDAKNVAFCYDFPSHSMMAIYRRLGINSDSEMLRLAKPLRLDRITDKLVKNRLVARGFKAMGNAILSAQDWSPLGGAKLDLSFHRGACGDEFSEVGRLLIPRCGMVGDRSAEYLNWRYVNNPLTQYEIITGRADGALQIYAVITIAAQNATLVDLLCVDDPAVLKALLKYLVAILRKRKIVTLSAPMIASHPWLLQFEKLRFKIRDRSPVIFYSNAKEAISGNGPRFLTHGDRDS